MHLILGVRGRGSTIAWNLTDNDSISQGTECLAMIIKGRTIKPEFRGGQTEGPFLYLLNIL